MVDIMKDLKIVFSGLVNSGKTSILRILDNDLEKIPSVTPTHGILLKTFRVLGLDVVAWDMGGQSIDRRNSSGDFLKYIGDTRILFYVVDFQAEKLYDESIAYLSSIIEGLGRQQLPEFFISILFHKIDPHVRVNHKMLERNIRYLQERFDDVLGIVRHQFFETSIYDSHSMFTAFSEGLLHQVTGLDIFYQKVHSITTEFNSQAGILVSFGGQIYGAWHSKSIQIIDLLKFHRTVQGFSHLISNSIYAPFIILPLTEMYNIAAIVFPVLGQFFTFCIIVPKLKHFEDLRVKLLDQREELIKLFSLFLETPILETSLKNTPC